jgi:anti-anti-sigma regulatory factor
MHHITSFAVAGATTIEVDGSLDVVSAYDLRCCLDSALRQGADVVGLDLTRVTDADVDGVRGLRRCCEAAVAAGVVLTMTGCSRPLRADLAAVEAGPWRERQRTDPRSLRDPSRAPL